MAGNDDRFDEVSFEVFCFRYRLHRRNAAELRDAIKDEGAFRLALRSLNQCRDRKISRKFTRLIVSQALLSERNSEEAKGAKPAFRRVSKKALLDAADRVSTLSEELKSAVDTLLELAIPASLAAPDAKSINGSLHGDISIVLPRFTEHVAMIGNIAKKCRVEFANVGTGRDIHPMDTPQHAFAQRLARIWTSAGHAVKTTAGGKFDHFVCWAYQAATGKVLDSASRLLSEALKMTKAIKATPESPEDRERLADRARHALVFHEQIRGAPPPCTA